MAVTGRSCAFDLAPGIGEIAHEAGVAGESKCGRGEEFWFGSGKRDVGEARLFILADTAFA